MNVVVIEYPVLTISKDGTIDVSETQDDLTVCSNVALKNNYYKGLVIIDKNCKQYSVETARKLKKIPFYWGLSSLVMPSMVKVDLVFSTEVISKSYEEVLSMIISHILKNNTYASIVGGDEIESEIKGKKSITEIMEYFVELSNRDV